MADSKISALTDGTTPATTDASPWARSGGTTVKLTWAELLAAMPGHEIGYDQITSPVNVASTTEATGTSIIAGSSYTFDGAPVICEFWAPHIYAGSASATFVVVSLFEGSTEITKLVQVSNPAQAVNGPQLPAVGRYRFTPSAGAHTYKATAFATSTTGTPAVGAGVGSTGGEAPAFLRFTKV